MNEKTKKHNAPCIPLSKRARVELSHDDEFVIIADLSIIERKLLQIKWLVTDSQVRSPKMVASKIAGIRAKLDEIEAQIDSDHSGQSMPKEAR